MFVLSFHQLPLSVCVVNVYVGFTEFPCFCDSLQKVSSSFGSESDHSRVGCHMNASFFELKSQTSLASENCTNQSIEISEDRQKIDVLSICGFSFIFMYSAHFQPLIKDATLSI